MRYGISATVDLDDLDSQVEEHCKLKKLDYSIAIDAIETELYELNGVDEVMFNHSNWIRIEMDTDDFDVAKLRLAESINEIEEVFDGFIKNGY